MDMLGRIAQILKAHGIHFSNHRNCILASDVSCKDGVAEVSEKEFTESTSLDEVYIWLGY